MFVVAGHLTFQRRELSCKLLVGGENLTQPHKGPDHKDAHLDGTSGVQDACSHDGPVLCKGAGEGRGKLEPLEVVAICDHLIR